MNIDSHKVETQTINVVKKDYKEPEVEVGGGSTGTTVTIPLENLIEESRKKTLTDDLTNYLPDKKAFDYSINGKLMREDKSKNYYLHSNMGVTDILSFHSQYIRRILNELLIKDINQDFSLQVKFPPINEDDIIDPEGFVGSGRGEINDNELYKNTYEISNKNDIHQNLFAITYMLARVISDVNQLQLKLVDQSKPTFEKFVFIENRDNHTEPN